VAPSESSRASLCAYRIMWLFAMFDLPVGSKAQRKRYAQFRKGLLQLGFTKLQFSVYARHCPTEDSMRTHSRHVRAMLPSEGEVRLLGVTDRQFGKMEAYFGEKRVPPEVPPAQLMLF